MNDARHGCPKDVLDRGLPTDLDAEAAVLASVLIQSSCFAEVADLLSVCDFIDPIHATIFASMLALHRRGQPIDLTLLIGELRDTGRLAVDHTGVQRADLLHLFKLNPIAANFEHYCTRLRTVSRRRHAYQRGLRLIQAAHLDEWPKGPAAIRRAAEHVVANRARLRRKGK